MSQNRHPIITIITVVYNCKEGLEKTIKSIIDQTYPYIEYIVIDGNSNEGTIDIIKKYQNKITYWISEPDEGIYDAMNKGIRLSTGDWINFMNAGDRFYDPNTLSSLFIPVPKPSSEIIYGDTEFIYTFGKYIRKPASLTYLKESMIFCHQSSFVRTYLLKKREFNTKYKICADYDFFLFCLREGRIFQYIPSTIAIFDAREGISSSNRIAREKEFGIISEHEQTTEWKIKYFNFIIYHYLKKSAKHLLPKELILKIKRWNFKRITKTINYPHEHKH